MSPYLILLGLVAVLFLIILVLVYKNRADTKAHAAAIQQTIAEAVQAKNQHRERLDDQLHTLHEQQRHETIESNKHLADRHDFDNDWNGMPIALTGNNAADRSAVAPNSAGSTRDNGQRIGLSDG